MGNSYQIQADIVNEYDKLRETAFHCGRALNGNGRFNVIIMDPPWANTGLKNLPFGTLKDGDWMSKLHLQDFQDEGLVFIWVVNSSMSLVKDWMEQVQGYDWIENIQWMKMQKNGKVLRRGGFTLFHGHETCMVFRKLLPGTKVESIYKPRQGDNVITTT